MRTRGRYCYSGLFVICTLAVLLGGCTAIPVGNAAGGNGSPVAGGSTATTTPAGPCATQATARAEAWVSLTANPQVSGSINGGPDTMLSHFVYPLGLPYEGQFGNDYLAAVAWAPDARHLAVAVLVNVGPAQALFPYIVDTTSHAVTRVALPDSAGIAERAAANRVFAWANDHTLLIFGAFSGGDNGSAGTVSYSYDITSSRLAPLPGITAAYEGVVRCSTLFYLEISPLVQIGKSGSYKGVVRLHRYNLTTRSESGAPITLGDTSTFRGAEGVVDLPGWDASPDGTRIVYQQTHVFLGSNQQLVTTSTFFAANADGRGAAAVLTGATANQGAFLAISPDGQQVAVTNAQPTPVVLSGSVSGGAAHYYQPDAYGPPVWLADSTQFEAELSPGSGEGVERWGLNTGGGKAPGATVHQSSGSPAALP